MGTPSAGSGARHIGHQGMISRLGAPASASLAMERLIIVRRSQLRRGGVGLSFIPRRRMARTAASGGGMNQPVRFEETLRRLAMIDESFVEDQAGLTMRLAGTSALHSKT